MICNDLFEATEVLGRNLYRFNGHSVDIRHTSYMFDAMARDIDFLNRVKSAVSVNYAAEIYADGRTTPVTVTMSGTSIFDKVEIIVHR